MVGYKGGGSRGGRKWTDSIYSMEGESDQLEEKWRMKEKEDSGVIPGCGA